MEGRCGEKRSMTKVVPWTARLWSIASVGLILFFIVGEGVKIGRPSEWLLFLFFPIGICAGMILAWWKEEIGGSIAVGSLLLFYMIHFASARRFPRGWRSWCSHFRDSFSCCVVTKQEM
jgi:hypothetical protein